MSNGWIKLHRKLMDNPIYKKPSWLSVWLTLLLLANHDDNNSFIWNGQNIHHKRGQFITGRKKINELTGVPETTIERVLNWLESEHQIGQQKTPKYRLITILKWEEYQNVDNKTDNRRTTDGQQTDTINKGKNEKNEKNTIAEASSAQVHPFFLKEEILKMENSPRRDINIIAMYLEKKLPDIQNREQLSVAIKRHLRAAQSLSSFTNNQIIDAIPKAEKLTHDWTLETLIKMLTK